MFRAENNVWAYVALTGGAGIVLYFFFNMIVCCLVDKKFQNYIVSELYTAAELADGQGTNAGDGVDDEDADAPPSKGCCGGQESLTRKRHHTSSNFHNEIFGAEDKILNRSKVGCSYRMCRYMI